MMIFGFQNLVFSWQRFSRGAILAAFLGALMSPVPAVASPDLAKSASSNTAEVRFFPLERARNYHRFAASQPTQVAWKPELPTASTKEAPTYVTQEQAQHILDVFAPSEHR